MDGDRRQSTRANVGLGPARLNYDKDDAGRIVQLSTVDNPLPPARKRTGKSKANSVTSFHSNKSTSSLHLEADIKGQKALDKLEEAFEISVEDFKMLEITVARQKEKIVELQQKLSNAENESEKATLKTNIEELEKTYAEEKFNLDMKRIKLDSLTKSYERKKRILQEEIALEKVVIDEQNSDNDSQHLSDNEDEQTFGLFDDLPPNTSERHPAVINEKEQTAKLHSNWNELIGNIENIRIPEPVKTVEPEIDLESQDLLERLNRLRSVPEVVVLPQVESKPEDPPKPDVSSGNSTSEQIALALAKAIEVMATSSQSTSSTDKFLARQVQGRDLPIFNGRPEEWATFITAYENSTAACKYENGDNLPRLQKCLKGEAAKTVQCLFARPENVPTIIEKLRMRFGKPEHIVQALIVKAKEVPAVKEDKLEMLIDLGLAVDNLVETIKAVKADDHLSNPQLLDELTKKLPVSFRMKWAEWLVGEATRKKNLENFATWMARQTEFACDLCPPKWEENIKKRFPGKQAQGERIFVAEESQEKSSDTNAATSNSGSKPEASKTCAFCKKGGHKISACRSFAKEDVNDKWKFIREKRLCFSCLIFGHGVQSCKSKKECGKDGCKKIHHQLLHQEAKQEENKEEPVAEVISHATKSSKCATSNYINMLIIPVQLRGPKATIQCFAMLDPGANFTVMDDDTASKLGLEGKKKSFSHSGLHPLKQEPESRIVNLEILTKAGDKSFELKNVKTVPQLALPRQSVKSKVVKKWKHLQNLDIELYESGQPSILIGLDNVLLCATQELKIGPPNAPVAGRTELGWVLMGRVEEMTKTNFSFLLHATEDDMLHQLVKQHFTTEAFGVKVTCEKPRSQEDKLAKQIMDSTICRVGDSWETGLLWKAEKTELPSSKENALHRLYQMEKKMNRDPEFAKEYCSRIRQYEEKGFARQLTQEEALKPKNNTYYLPHFMARNPKKPKKLRFVFDAASKCNGVSLNDALLKGPDQLVPLPAVLFKFRQKRIGITADIQDMFHRVKVRSEDASAQRFLWRGMERKAEPYVYEMGVLIFGASCSPACAQEVKNRNALEYKEVYPEAVKAILEKHYVDDFLDSCDSVEECMRIYEEVSFIHAKGGFNICNWISSSPEVLARIPDKQKLAVVKQIDESSETERVLGLFWKPDEDSFTFSLKFLKAKQEILSGSRVPTKREVLALAMSIYDPLGFLALFTIRAKMILQETWRSKVSWDDEIPLETRDKFSVWLEELKSIPTFQLARCYSEDFSSADEIQLHVFVDASEQAFGAVAYFRIKKNEEVSTSFVAAKARVAPMKPISIPRMELQAAVLGARLARTIGEEHDMKINRRVFWSDSRTVICWLKSDGRKFQQFVSHRIGEIQEMTELVEWKWVPTQENVADEMTRDGKSCDWSPSSRWINGPEFLQLEENEWPTEKISSEVKLGDLELKKEFIFTITSLVEKVPILKVEDISSWTRLVRIIAYVRRFIKIYVEKQIVKGPLSVMEVRKAEECCIRKSQLASFPEEIRLLKKNKQLPKSSKLAHLTVGLDEEEIIRVRGRLENAVNWSRNQKNPIVLDSREKFTKLLISFYHVTGGHHGQERVVNELRQKFYILNLRRAVRSCWNHCQKCKNDRAQPKVPEMGQLPAFRLESMQMPFTKTGLDYFGPIEVTVGRHHEKRYGALFTCLATRAIHVEIASSLTTDSCIMAIRRFVSRRGCPTDIYSDNGTNFVGANNELRKALKEIDQDKMTTDCCVRGINWHFLPALCPHMGGSWERMVKAVKVAFFATLKERYPKDEVLLTLMAEAEHTVNCHPLTYVPHDPEDPEALTPNHFLLGKSSNVPMAGEFSESDLCLRKQWRQAQQLANHFWKRWVSEYLPTLLRREKWRKQQDPIKIGDVVVIVDSQLTRNSWPKGVIVAVYPGKDGQVRVADVRTATGTYKRPVAKLAVLDVLKDKEKMEVVSEEIV